METHSSVLAWRVPMDRVAWWARVHGVEKSQTQLSDEAQQSINITVSSILFLGETWQFSFHLVLLSSKIYSTPIHSTLSLKNQVIEFYILEIFSRDEEDSAFLKEKLEQMK